jgi:hypothetical protein
MIPFTIIAVYTYPPNWGKVFTFETIPLLFFILLVWLSYFVNGWGNSKSLNHSIAYSVSLLVYFLLVKLVIIQLNSGEKFLIRLLTLLTLTTLLSATFACIEFILKNFYGIDLGSLVPRGDLQEYDALAIELFQRARGFAIESGHFTFMMEMFIPITIYFLFFSNYCRWPTIVKITFLVICFASIIFAASSASFLILPGVLLVTIVIYRKRFGLFIAKHKRIVIFYSGLATAFVILLNKYFSLYTLIVTSVIDKFDSNSYDEREYRYRFFYDIFPAQPIIQKIIGVGPSGFRLLGYDDSYVIISFYLNVTFELGLLGVFFLLLFLALIIYKCLCWKSPMAPFVFASILGGAAHYYIIGNYYYPWFWFVCAIPFLDDYKVAVQRKY